MDRFYVTTPIYYVTDKPHIGHAYTTIAADVLARYWRAKLGAENVFFSVGTDEHGAKIAEAAKTAGAEPLAFVTRLARTYQTLWDELTITSNVFLRTTDERHVAYAQRFWQELYDKGEVSKGVYEGLYCVGCEKFLSESELAAGRCPDHPTKELVRHKEENYFFALSQWAPEVEKLIEKGTLAIAPIERRNEILARLRQGVHDLSISRAQVNWGIPIPWDRSQTIYVWIEALLNYASALEISGKTDFWPPTVQLMGKEILWFHAVIWPAMLLAAGRPLPKRLFAHGWFTVGGEKMSKTLGNVIDPALIAATYGSDALRYFLLSATTFGEDGDMSQERFASQYAADLANGLGNLLQRTLVLRHKFGVKVAPGSAPSCAEADRLTENLQFDGALKEIWRLITAANQQLEREAPWQESDAEKRTKTLVTITRQLETIGAALEPYLPTTAQAIADQLQTDVPDPLFPRI